MKTIVLLCNQGMSTSLLVSKMVAEAKESNVECTINAYPVSEASTHKDADIILLGPQVRFELNKVKEAVNCPVAVIDIQAYGMVNGKKVLQQALEGMK